MKTIIYTCPYVPAEWIAAHGLRASRLLLDHVDSASMFIRTEGVCPFVRSFISEVMKNKGAGGVVATTVCDQMRRAFDVLVRKSNLPAFLMNVPNTWQSLAAQKLYIDELKRLSRFLSRLGGKSPSNNTLAKIMLEYDAARGSILTAREYLSARQYAEAIAAFGRNGPDQTINRITGTEPQTDGVRLAMIGGPLMKQDFDLFDLIEQSGGRIVLDATETGERGLCVPFDHRRLRDEPLMELADAYFGGIRDASRRPNSELYKWLQRELASRDVQGIIFRRYLWCDIWHAELRRLKDFSNLPVLDIDTAGDNDIEQQRTVNRIRAFLEMLQ
ncbi:MAG TPA: 2-hydroxyacyl-CoA dehydratase family protein [Sedimentisphaerales bacterium]|nr:2-hydroxyacyl-CoA dehydratase family protein [Sedimentisphaerales bacterium]